MGSHPRPREAVRGSWMGRLAALYAAWPAAGASAVFELTTTTRPPAGPM